MVNMEKQKALPEPELEVQIEDAVNRACNENLSLEARRESERDMKFLISKRSQEQIRRMEIERGLM